MMPLYSQFDNIFLQTGILKFWTGFWLVTSNVTSCNIKMYLGSYEVLSWNILNVILMLIFSLSKLKAYAICWWNDAVLAGKYFQKFSLHSLRGSIKNWELKRRSRRKKCNTFFLATVRFESFNYLKLIKMFTINLSICEVFSFDLMYFDITVPSYNLLSKYIVSIIG